MTVHISHARVWVGDRSPTAGAAFFRTLEVLAESDGVRAQRRAPETSGTLTRLGKSGGRSKLSPRQAREARQMYDEIDDEGRHLHTVAEIIATFGVSRPTMYRYLKSCSSGGSTADQLR